MDCPDLCVAAEKNLASEMGIGRILPQTVCNGVRDACAQFPGRCSCEGDDQKTVNVFRLGIGVTGIHILHEALGQDAGLSAARSCRDQHTAAAAGDRLQLCTCKIHQESSFSLAQTTSSLSFGVGTLKSPFSPSSKRQML